MEVDGNNGEESVPPRTEETAEDSTLVELSEEREQGSERPLMSAEADKKETSEKPKNEKKSKFMRKIGLLKRRIQRIEKDILETEEKVGTVMNEFQLTKIPIGSEYQLEDTAPQKYSPDVAPTIGKQPEQNGNEVKVERQRDHQLLKTSSSSSFATSSSSSEGPRIVSLLKGLKLQQKSKLSPITEAVNISSVKIPPPSLKVPPVKKEVSPKETPITKKFSINFEQDEETEKYEDKNFNSFSLEKTFSETIDFPWVPINQDKIKPQKENVNNIDLDPFAADENWFDKAWSSCPPIANSSVWGDASSAVGTMHDENFDTGFSDIFNEPLKQSDSHEVTEIISDQSLPKIVETENKPKKKKPFKWIRNLFHKRSKKAQKD